MAPARASLPSAIEGNAMSPPYVTNHLAKDVAKRSEGGGVLSQSKNDKATSWLVPPLVIPTFLIILIVARIAYVASL
jgi:hypothetical protein